MKPIQSETFNGIRIKFGDETLHGVNLTFEDGTTAAAFESDKRDGYFKRIVVPFDQEVENVVICQ